MVYLKRSPGGDSQHQAQWDHLFRLRPQAHPFPQPHDFRKADKAAGFTSSPDNIQSLRQQGPHIKGFLFCCFFSHQGEDIFPGAPSSLPLLSLTPASVPVRGEAGCGYQNWCWLTSTHSWELNSLPTSAPTHLQKPGSINKERNESGPGVAASSVWVSAASFLQRGNNSTSLTGLVWGWNKITKLDHQGHSKHSVNSYSLCELDYLDS